MEEFYEQLESTIKEIPRKDLLVIQGDWNAKVGPDAYEERARTVGPSAVGETNERGHRLMEFAHRHNVALVNTLFPYKISRRTTSHSPDVTTRNQLDNILTLRRFKSNINRAKSRANPGADISGDHDLVMMTMKLNLKKNVRAKYSCSTLKSLKTGK